VWDPQSRGAVAFMEFAKELVEREGLPLRTPAVDTATNG
jgi:hypothetical protein